MSTNFNQVIQSDLDAYSFDIFDTVLTRITVEPKGVFLAMQHIMNRDEQYRNMPLNLKFDFQDIRLYAESFAYKHRVDTEEIKLETIYKKIAQEFALNRSQMDQLLNLEKETEYTLSVGIHQTIELIVKLIQMKKKVLFISDMYLDSGIIKRMLKKADARLAEIPVYVSSEYGMTKRKASLFKLVQSREHLICEKWMHIGDHLESDIRVPQTLGIKTFQITNTQIDSFSKFMIAKYDHNLSVEINLGISRYLNINKGSDINCNYYVGSTFGAIIFLPYVQWILDQAQIRQIKTLYFLSRDGYILKIIADYIIKQCKLHIKTKYLYGSRKAMQYQDDNSKSNLIHYLEQEIDLKERECVIVDVFGTGKTLNFVGEILHTLYGKNLTLFYYHNSENLKLEHCQTVVYTKNIDVWNNIELFCKAPHGQVSGYRLDGIDWKPVMVEKEGELLEQFGIIKYFQGVKDFITLYLQIDSRIKLNRLHMTELRSYIDYINLFPNDSLLHFLLEFPQYPEKQKNKLQLFVKKIEIKTKKVKYLIKIMERQKLGRLF